MERLRESLAEFEQKSGVKIDEWRGGRIGEAVAKVLRARGVDPADELSRAARQLEFAAEALRKEEKLIRNAVALLPEAS